MEMKTRYKFLLYAHNFLLVLVLYVLIQVLFNLAGIYIHSPYMKIYDIFSVKVLLFPVLWTLLTTKPKKYRQTVKSILKSNEPDTLEHLKEILGKQRWKLQDTINGEHIFVPKYRLFKFMAQLNVREEESAIKVSGPEIYVDLCIDHFFEVYKKPIYFG